MTELAEELLGRMTIEEKVAQLGGAWFSRLVGRDGLDEDQAAARLGHGIGQVTRISGETSLLPEQAAQLANEIQRHLVERTRLGIPAIIHEESLAGLSARGATQFPQAIGLASTWAPELVEAMGEVIREQMLGVGARQTLAPVLDVTRDPRWGRVEETYGEDPYLAARMGVAYVRGVQGPVLARGVAATAKHFIAYGLSEGGMNHAPAHVGPRQLREVVAAPFRAVVHEAGLASVMNAYNSIDGLPCGSSAEVLDALLRRELGFDGLVVSDYWSVNFLMTHHAVAADQAEAAARALEAGLDVELPALSCYRHLPALVEKGRLPLEVVDRAVARVLRLKSDLGLFDDPYVDETAAAGRFDTAEQRALARRLAQQSIVLLSNDGVLPLSSSLSSVAVVGPAADDVRLFLGDYHYPAHQELLFDRAGPFPAGPHYVPMVSLAAAMAERTAVAVARGCDITDPSTEGFAEAVRAARRAAVAVVAVGGRSGLTRECTTGELRDASQLGLPGAQQQLVEAVVGTGTPTVVVLVGGRPLAVPWIAEHAAAVVQAWLPGEEGGPALADVLFGAVSPSGRLPISMPRSEGQVPVYHGHLSGGGSSQMYGDYTDSPTTPLYPFGHGISYTVFEYRDLVVEPDLPATDGSFSVSCTVANAGSVPGEEVVQLYLRDVVASVARPVRQLAGFARVELEPGQERRVRFEVDAALLGFYDERMRFVVEPGEVRVMVGASSDDVRLQQSLTLTGGAHEHDPNEVRPTAVDL